MRDEFCGASVLEWCSVRLHTMLCMAATRPTVAYGLIAAIDAVDSDAEMMRLQQYDADGCKGHAALPF